MLKRCDIHVQERGFWKKRRDSEGQKQVTDDDMPTGLTLGKADDPLLKETCANNASPSQAGIQVAELLK